ncbi:zona pellucida-like domain-containing protein 1 [Amia ocellicauda]|uniref:zona pellucida-like domain-containing protein 1 n=1 Tax=Amia ocellicauda TaxID=2972642 RepID=UPI003463EFAA
MPAYDDISVACGSSTMDLAVQICPAVYAGYNESLLYLNYVFDDPRCKGKLDITVTPPVVRFSFPINESTGCGSIFRTITTPGTGIFSDFSNIQTVNISGVIRSNDPTIGTVTYNQELVYLYSCAYPLEYLINNTRIDVSGASISVKDNNGSFISTLSLQLYKDVNYTAPLIIPSSGIDLKSDVYVQVKAVNLTSKFNVLLDRCYATTSLYSTNSTYFNLFVSCSRDALTTMILNGDNQYARFSFKAFRFIEQKNLTVATYYLHCITRLCDVNSCSQFKKCSRKRRNAIETTTPVPDGLSEATTITSVPIHTKAETVLQSKEVIAETKDAVSSISVGLGIAVAFLALISITMIAMAYMFYQKTKQATGMKKMFPN